MSEQQNLSSMDIDNYAMGANTSNIINNYFASPVPTPEPLPNLPNQILESLTIIKKYLSRQEKDHSITITKNEVKVNNQLIHVNYEACKICKIQHGNLTCPTCQRKICSRCITKRSKKPPQFFYCLLGKPGVGKSMISERMASALRRPFVQINMGGQNSTSIIIGDHASYQGAKFDDIVKGMSTRTYMGRKSKGAVILLDELEKVSEQSVLDTCGILFDKNLNKNFKDNFLESVCDLSEVFFLCTANYEELVPDFVNSRCKFVDIKLQSYRERQEIAIDTLKVQWKENMMGSLGDPTITRHKGYDVDIIPHNLNKENDLLWWCIDCQWGVRGMVQNITSLVSQLLEIEMRGKLKGMDLNAWTNKSKDGKADYRDGGEHFGEKTLIFEYANGEKIKLGKFLSKEVYNGKWVSVITEVNDWNSPYEKHNPDWRPPEKEGQVIYTQKDYKEVKVEEVSKGDTSQQTASFWIYFPETEVGGKKVERLRLSRVVAKELGLAVPQKYTTHKPTLYIFELFIKEGFNWMRDLIDYRKERILTPDEYIKLRK